MKLKQLFFILMCVLYATNFYATDYYVKSTGQDSNDGLTEDNAFLTLGQAVTTAVNGDKIIIIGTVDNIATISFNKTLTFEGQSNAVLNSTGARFFTIPGGSANTISFSNITFQNAAANVQGAVLNSSTQTGMIFSFVNCNFLNNTTSNDNGGGVFIFSQDASVTITGCTFYNNAVVTSIASNARGGAINIFSTASANISNCTFYGNKVARNINNGDAAAIRVNTATNVVNISNSLYNNKINNGIGISSDVAAIATATVNITNSLAQVVVNVTSPDITTGSTFSNTDFLASSNLSFDAGLNKITFTAPSLLTDATPIDFGLDKNDVGSWDSKINLFKGTTNSDWATGSNWSSTAIPTSLENVTLLSDSPALVIGGATTATINNLSVDASSSLTINSGGVLIVNGTSTGNVTYKRNLGTTNWYLVSAPVNGEDMTDMRANNTFADGSGGGRIGFAPYLTSGNSWSYFTTSSTDALIAGIGYSAKLASAGDLSFTGTINTADVSVAVANTGTGFNLIGNPFTSHLNSATFLTDNSANLVSQTLWVWDGSTYDTKVTGESFVLAPGQGFFVRASTGTNLNIAESYQATTGGTFQKTSNTEVKLMMNDGSNNRFAKMYYLDNATKGFDNGFDGETFGGIENTVDVFTNLVANNEGKKYQVQSLPIAEMETMIVPVGLKADAGKEITFTAEALNLPNDLKVFLEDRLTNTFTRLDEANSSYKVTLNDALNGTGRFFLHTKASGVLSTDEVVLQNTSIYAINNNTLRVVGLPSGNANVKMYSILGKQVMSTSFSSTGVKDISLPKLSTGMYIIQLETATGKLNKKIVLE